jgi:hypothetical protein
MMTDFSLKRPIEPSKLLLLPEISDFPVSLHSGFGKIEGKLR